MLIDPLIVGLYIMAVLIIALLIATLVGVRELIYMHKHAEQFGLGTVRLQKHMKEYTTAINALLHYMKWFVKESVGKIPPPPPPAEVGFSDEGPDRPKF